MLFGNVITTLFRAGVHNLQLHAAFNKNLCCRAHCTCHLNISYGHHALIKTLCLLYILKSKGGQTYIYGSRARLNVWKNRSNGKNFEKFGLTGDHNSQK